MEYYFPSKLKAIRKQIEKDHPIRGRKPKMEVNEALRELVLRVVGWESSKVISNGKLLDPDQITNLCMYAPGNAFNVDCKNIYAVIRSFATEDDLWTVYLGWQDYYSNDELKNNVLESVFTGPEINDILTIIQKKAEIRKISSWIKTDYPQILLDIIGTLTAFDSVDDFGRELKTQGIEKERKLYFALEPLFYLNCSRSAYLNLSDVQTGNIYKGFGTAYKAVFLSNYICEMRLSDLERREYLFDAVETSFKSTNVKILIINALKKNGQINKYEQWKSLMTLKASFEDTARFDFWKKYVIDVECVRVQQTDSMYMDFGEYVITEFYKNADGPAYCFKRKYFQDDVLWRMRANSKQKLKVFLKQQSRRVGRWIHQPGWQNKFSLSLGRLGIYPVQYK